MKLAHVLASYHFFNDSQEISTTVKLLGAATYNYNNGDYFSTRLCL